MRLYNSNDFKMLIAAKTILLNYNSNFNILKNINSNWNKNRINHLIQELDITLNLYNKVSTQTKISCLGHKLVIYKIHAFKAVKHLKNIIDHKIEDPEECVQILKLLSLNTEFDLTEDPDIDGLITILIAIKQNLNSKISDRICTNKSEEKCLKKILAYTHSIPRIYYSYKSLIAVRKTINKYAISKYNYIYSSIMDIINEIPNTNINPIQNSVDYIKIIDTSKKENIFK